MIRFILLGSIFPLVSGAASVPPAPGIAAAPEEQILSNFKADVKDLKIVK